MGKIAYLRQQAENQGVTLTTVEETDGRQFLRLSLADIVKSVPLYGRGRTRAKCFLACLSAIDSVALGKFPKTWDETPKPEWVPDDQWAAVMKFWDWHGGPRQWIDSQRRSEAPETGTRVGVFELKPGRGFGWICREQSPATVKRGRYLYCWGNIGRVVTDDGELLYVSHGRQWDTKR